MELDINLEVSTMKISLTKSLLISFVIIILISLITTGIISTYMIDSKFDVYLLEEHNEKIGSIKLIINSALEKNMKSPDFDREGLKRYAISENYFIEIKNLDDETIYSTGNSHLVHNQMMGPMMSRKLNRSLKDYKEDVYSINVDNSLYGRVIIGYFGPSNMSQEALTFKMTLYSSILISSILAIILATLIALLISRQLGITIKKINNAAKEITRGNLSFRNNTKTNIKEIHDLSQSINHLASTLEDQENIRRRLTSDMAHEIRTPLTTIKSHIEAFIDGIWEPTSHRLNDCYDEVNRLTNLVESIEDINKLNKSSYILNKTVFNLGNELSKVVDSIVPQFIKKDLHINFINEANIEVLIDKDKLRQIMYNLLSNAYKYSFNGGIVNVKSFLDKNSIIIEVEDFGIGISPEDTPHIFEYLYRGDTSRSRENGGSGIGLAVTETLVKAHKGTIVVKSKEGSGSIFRVTLPLEEFNL